MAKGKECCSEKYMWIFGVIMLILAWLLWVGSMTFEKVFAILLIIFGIKKIWMSFKK
ncbi:MAG: hypothetical protein ABIB47_00645 [Candidatus Woesearchaeota archaeon]